MATVEERMKILKMIEDGKISAEDGAKLLAALSDSRKTGSPPVPPAPPGGDARWFRLRVTDLDTGKSKVNVNIPVGLANVGIKMGARFAPGLNGEAIAEALKSGAIGKIVEVTDEDGRERIEIFVE